MSDFIVERLAQEKYLNSVLRKSVENLNDELTAAKAEAEQFRGRVGELEESVTELIEHYSETWDLPILKRAEAVRDGCGQSWLLRKQAEAVEPAIRTALRNFGNADITEEDISAFAYHYAQRLRQQAEAAEKGGDDETI